MINSNRIESLIKTIKSLSQDEIKTLENQLFFNSQDVSIQEIINLSKTTNSFDFLHDEPDIYTLEDGEAI